MPCRNNVAGRPKDYEQAVCAHAEVNLGYSVVLGNRVRCSIGWATLNFGNENREGDLNDIRAILGNDTAIKAYREGKLPFPDGTIIARIAWSYVPSEENNKVFGRSQSFVPGAAPD